MTEEYYTELRRSLVQEFLQLRNVRCYLAAKARIRKIADLDFEFRGIDREVTKQKFNYSKIGGK